MAEEGSDLVRDTMQEAAGWFMCRVGYVETVRAVELVAGHQAARRAHEEWGAIGVVEVDQELAEEATSLAPTHGLRSLDALHLAAALLLPRAELVLATWDKRLRAAALTAGLRVLPDGLE